MEPNPCAEERRLILELICPWAGSLQASLRWYKGHRIAALGGLTAEQLVEQGRTRDVLEYLRHIGEGGYA